MADPFTQVRGQGAAEDPRPTRKAGSVYKGLSTDTDTPIANEPSTPSVDVETQRGLGKPVTPTR